MTQSMTQETRSGPGGGGAWRWLAFLAVAGVGLGAFAILLGGDGTARSDPRAADIALGADDLATATGSQPTDFRLTTPPIDVGVVERAARAATGGRFPLPDSRSLTTLRHATTGEEVTQGVLLYDDPAQAAALDAIASPLLGSSFGLLSEPIDLDGASDARRWTRTGYEAVTFRVAGLVGFVGTTDTRDPARAERLAASLRDRMLAMPTATVAPSTP